MSQFPGDMGSVYMRRRHDPFAQYDPRRDMTPRVNRPYMPSGGDLIKQQHLQMADDKYNRMMARPPAGRRTVPNIPGYQRSPGKGRGPSGPGKGRGRSLPGKGGGSPRQRSYRELADAGMRTTGREPGGPLSSDRFRNIGNVPPSMGNLQRSIQEAFENAQKGQPFPSDLKEALQRQQAEAEARVPANSIRRSPLYQGMDKLPPLGPSAPPSPFDPRQLQRLQEQQRMLSGQGGPSQNYRENLFRQPPPSFDPRGSGAIASGEVQLPGHQGRIGQRPGMPPEMPMPGGRGPMAGGSYFDEGGNRVDFGGGNRGPVASIPTPVGVLPGDYNPNAPTPPPPIIMPGYPPQPRGPSGPGKGRGPIMGSPGGPGGPGKGRGPSGPGKGRGPSGPGKGRGPIGSPGFPSPGKGRGPSGPGKGRGPSMPGKGRQNMPQPGGYYPQPPSSPSYPDAGIPPFSAPPSYNAPVMPPGYGQMQNTADRFAGYGIPQNMTGTFQFPHYQPYTPPAPSMQTGPEPYQPEPQPPSDPYRPPGSPADPANPPYDVMYQPNFTAPMTGSPNQLQGPTSYQPPPQQPAVQPDIGLPGRGGFGFDPFGGYSGIGF